MWSFTKGEELSPEQIEELKNQWFSIDEAIEELAVNGDKLAVATFRRRESQVNKSKDFFGLGKPQIKKVKSGGKGASKKFYNRAFIEALQTIAISDTFIKVEEQPIDFYKSSDWKGAIKGGFIKTLKEYKVNQNDINDIVRELSEIVGEKIMPKYRSLEGQNKLLVHQNKKLEDTKEYYSSLYQGVEGNANVLNDIASFIKGDISNSSEMLSRKEAYHTKLTINVNQKLEEVLKLLKDIKDEGK